MSTASSPGSPALAGESCICNGILTVRKSIGDEKAGIKSARVPTFT